MRLESPATSTFWPGWVSGAALALIPIAYFWVHGRLLAVSGRLTTLVNDLRYGRQEAFEVDEDELVRALQAATAEVFGDNAVASHREPALAPQPPSAPPRRVTRFEVSRLGHLVFLLGIVGGGAFALDRGSVGWGLGGGATAALGESVLPAILLAGGMLVGFGTRMCGGCTMGHGLCGVPRAERGSLVSTLSFFGAGVAVALLLAALAG